MVTSLLTCGTMERGQSTTTAPRATVKEKSKMDLWKRIKRKENWESRMGPEYFLLIFAGSVISGILMYWF